MNESGSRITDLARSAAIQLAGTNWQLEVEPIAPAADLVDAPAAAEQPVAVPPRSRSLIPPPSETPPPLERIVEAMLFVGGPPLTAEAMAQVIRGLSAEDVRRAVHQLDRTYRLQARPYRVQCDERGYRMELRAEFRYLKDRLHGGPRQAKLGQAALDVLGVVAYLQPIAKGDIDAIRGADSASSLRQLVKLGLIAVSRRADAEGRAVSYGTTPRFLEFFGLSSLADLPRIEDDAR